MSAPKKSAMIVLGIVATGLYLAVPAGADPGFDPCRSGLIPICGMAPVMPDLDHDVDLTQDPNGLTGGQGPDQEPADHQPDAGPNGG
jgi:hypothetical protein